MNKELIIELIINKLNELEDIDDKLDLLSDLLVEYQEHPDYHEIFLNVYKSLNIESMLNEKDIDTRLVNFVNLLESTNELFYNEQYDKIIELLEDEKDYVDELMRHDEIDEDKFETCCFFNEIEKQLFFYIESDPNKDIHLINSYAGEYYSRLAFAYHNSFKYDNASECYKILLKYNPCCNQALMGMAYIAYIQENYLTAIEYIKEFSKYAFSNELIFEAYQILTNIYIQYGKYDYAAIFAFLGSSFSNDEEKMEMMLNIFEQHKSSIPFDFEDDSVLDNYLAKEELSYMPNDQVMDVLYTMLSEFRENPSKKEEFIDLSEIILSIVEDEEIENEYNELLKEFN